MASTCGVQPASGPGTPRQFRAVHPVYVGCVQVVPLSKEKYTPETPTPGVNGQVLSAPALHASMSTSSFEPATRTFGCNALCVSVGSFCLFCENGFVGLPFETRTSGFVGAA